MAIETISIKDAADVTRTVLADLIGSDYGQVIKLAFGADGTLTLVESSVGLPVALLARHGCDRQGRCATGAPGRARTASERSCSERAVRLQARSISTQSRLLLARRTRSRRVLASDAIMVNNLTALTPKFFKANVTASSTDSNLVTAVGGKNIRVISFRIHAAGTATNVTFNSKPGGAGTAISELFACGANGGRWEGFSRSGISRRRPAKV